ncbi:hypothetical protein QUA82_21695 [Microcoleus sp. F8-D3]
MIINFSQKTNYLPKHNKPEKRQMRSHRSKKPFPQPRETHIRHRLGFISPIFNRSPAAISPAPRNSHPSQTRFYVTYIQLIQILVLSALTVVQHRCTLGLINLNSESYIILFHLSIPQCKNFIGDRPRLKNPIYLADTGKDTAMPRPYRYRVKSSC